MLDFLAGVPGRLKTLTDRLSATWAAKVDALRTGLTDARMGYLDRLDVAISTRAAPSHLTPLAVSADPMLAPPIASGLVGHGQQVTYSYAVGVDSSATASTSYVTAHSYTGKGVLSFAMARISSGSNSCSLRITLDGVVVFEGNSATTTGRAVVGVGYYGAYPAFDAVPFRSSLLIEHKANAASMSIVTSYRYLKTA
jgi:hypothetical protein